MLFICGFVLGCFCTLVLVRLMTREAVAVDLERCSVCGRRKDVQLPYCSYGCMTAAEPDET